MADYSQARAREWFKTEEDLLLVCRDAVRQARSEGDQEFAADTLKRAQDYKLEMYVTQKQITNLCRIADHVPPVRRTK